MHWNSFREQFVEYAVEEKLRFRIRQILTVVGRAPEVVPLDSRRNTVSWGAGGKPVTHDDRCGAHQMESASDTVEGKTYVKIDVDGSEKCMLKGARYTRHMKSFSLNWAQPKKRIIRICAHSASWSSLSTL